MLVASTGGAGHFNPLIGFLECFRQRGDDVLLVVPPSLRPTLESLGYPFRSGDEPPAGEVEAIRQRLPVAPPGEASILGNRELFGRLCTKAMMPAMEAAFTEWRPQLVLRDPCDYASAIQAERLGVPQAQVAISTAEGEAGSLALAAAAIESYSRTIVASLRACPYLSRFPAALDPSPFPDTRRYREASGTARPLPGWWSSPHLPLVYVTFGSVTGSVSIAGAVFGAALQAVAGLPVRVLLTTGTGFDVSSLRDIPPNVHVETWVPQTDALHAATAVVCHGGSGTVFGTLAAALPLVVVPLFADQRTNAGLVTAAGAGVVVRPRPFESSASPPAEGLVDIGALKRAITSVLDDDAYEQAAARVAAQMRQAPSVEMTVEGLAAAAARGGEPSS